VAKILLLNLVAIRSHQFTLDEIRIITCALRGLSLIDVFRICAGLYARDCRSLPWNMMSFGQRLATQFTSNIVI